MNNMKTFNINGYEITVFGSDEVSFMVTATLIAKDDHAFLINAGFTRSYALEIVQYIKKKGLTLDKILILHGDPDYYFGLETIFSAFPRTIAYATQSIVEHIANSFMEKLVVWQDALKEDAPKHIVIPQILKIDTVAFRGLDFEIIGSDKTRINLYNSKLDLLIGGIDTFNEIHVFLADTSSIEEIDSWITSLDGYLDLNPAIVIPSHANLEKSFDRNAIIYTKEYLGTAKEALQRSKDSSEFVQFMKNKYPDLMNQGVLELGAKVLMKEIPWGKTQNKYKTLLHQTYFLTEQGKLDEFKTYLSDNVEWTEAAGFPYAGTYKGVDEVLRNVHMRLGSEWRDYKAEDILYAFNDKYVMVYGNYSGTYLKTEKYFKADFVHIYEFDQNDKIEKFIQVVDSKTVVDTMK